MFAFFLFLLSSSFADNTKQQSSTVIVKALLHICPFIYITPNDKLTLNFHSNLIQHFSHSNSTLCLLIRVIQNWVKYSEKEKMYNYIGIALS